MIRSHQIKEIILCCHFHNKLIIIFNFECRITSVSSLSHNFVTEIGSDPNESGQYSAKSQLTSQTTEMNRDIVVIVLREDSDQPKLYFEKSETADSSSLAGMISFVPSFQLKDQKTELIFLVDRSGSMDEKYYNKSGAGCLSSIDQAVRVLDLFVHSMPADCYFNIFSFGSNFDSIFEKSQKYDDGSMAAAIQHVREMKASYGGTEIYPALEEIFKQPQISGKIKI